MVLAGKLTQQLNYVKEFKFRESIKWYCTKPFSKRVSTFSQNFRDWLFDFYLVNTKITYKRIHAFMRSDLPNLTEINICKYEPILVGKNI